MDEEMKEKIEAVLENVKDPESGYPVARLGVVERVRYNAEKKEMYVFTEFLSHRPSCITCTGVAAIVVAGICRDLQAAFEAAFPELSVLLL